VRDYGFKTVGDCVRMMELYAAERAAYLSRQLIEKYVSDLRGQGLIPD
jgi:hypothetical protein